MSRLRVLVLSWDAGLRPVIEERRSSMSSSQQEKYLGVAFAHQESVSLREIFPWHAMRTRMVMPHAKTDWRLVGLDESFVGPAIFVGVSGSALCDCELRPNQILSALRRLSPESA